MTGGLATAEGEPPWQLSACQQLGPVKVCLEDTVPQLRGGSPAALGPEGGQSRGTPDKASGIDPRASQGEPSTDILWEERKNDSRKNLRLEKKTANVA